MHNAAFRALGLNWVYVPFPVRAERLGDAIRGFRAIGVRGVNVTVPHKRSAMEWVDLLGPEAEFIGAVNTLTFQSDGTVRGDNTDARGFLAALQEAEFPSVEGQQVVVLGAGGAARAVVAALAQAGAQPIVIANRTVEKAEQLAEELQARLGIKAMGIPLLEAAVQAVLHETVLLVNTTSAGMEGKPPLEFNPELLRPPLAVCDIIYTPPETELLRAAAARGCRTLNGVGMLVHQGAIAFELWTGIAPPVEIMREALLNALNP